MSEVITVQGDKQRAQFETKARDPIQWLNRARRLRHAARRLQTLIETGLAMLPPDSGAIIFEDENQDAFLWDPYYLLAAFALENLLKGICVQRDPSRVRDGKFFLKTHDLVKLASLAGFRLNELQIQQAFHLFEATEAATWSARYPIPLEATKRQSYTIVQGPGVFSTFEALFTLFEEKLAPNGAPRNTWQTIGKGKTD